MHFILNIEYMNVRLPASSYLLSFDKKDGLIKQTKMTKLGNLLHINARIMNLSALGSGRSSSRFQHAQHNIA